MGTTHDSLIRKLNRRVRSHWYHRVGGVTTVDGLRLRLDRRLSRAQISLILAGRAAQPEMTLFPRWLRPADVVMEVGGGIAYLAMQLARSAAGVTVHTFEPNPVLEGLAAENIRLNRLPVEFQPYMLGPEAGERRLAVSEHYTMTSLYENRWTTSTVTVPMRPFLTEFERIDPTVLVVDTEGQEPELFALLPPAAGRLRIVACEFHPERSGADGVAAARRVLGDLGFELAESIRDDRHCVYRRRGAA